MSQSIQKRWWDILLSIVWSAVKIMESSTFQNCQICSSSSSVIFHWGFCKQKTSIYFLLQKSECIIVHCLSSFVTLRVDSFSIHCERILFLTVMVNNIRILQGSIFALSLSSCFYKISSFNIGKRFKAEVAERFVIAQNAVIMHGLPLRFLHCDQTRMQRNTLELFIQLAFYSFVLWLCLISSRYLS